MNELANAVFSHLCHQEALRCWAPGGNVVAFCQRCSGVYVGAALCLFLLFFARFKTSRVVAWIHGVFMLQMIVFGFHFVPHSATIRTLSGQLFIIGVFYFLWVNVQNRFTLEVKQDSPLWYFVTTVLALVFLQALVRLPFSFETGLVNFLGLLGIVSIVVFAIITAISFLPKKKQ